MKVRIVRATAIKGYPVNVGEIIDVDDPTAMELFYCRKAEAYIAPPILDESKMDRSAPSEEAIAPTDKQKRRK